MPNTFRVLTILVALSLGAPAAGLAAPSPIPSIDAYLRSLVPYGFSGNVLIARDGKPLLAQGYGIADREKNIPLGPNTAISVGSITKQFTAAAIMKLQDEGKVHVSDSIAKYLPDVPADKRAITLQMLLTHTAGLRSDYGSTDDEAVGRDTYIKRVMEAPLDAAPGALFEYSNAGYSLLAAIVELTTNGSYEKFLHDALFVPAGMANTGYLMQKVPAGGVAVGYRDGNRWGTIAGRDYPKGEPYWNLIGNGGIQSTPADMLRWDRTLDNGHVLSVAAMQALRTGYVSEGDNGGPNVKYGYGWDVMQTPHGRLITHNGGNGVFAADFLRYIDAGITVYIASTSNAVPATMLSRRIARAAFGDMALVPAPSIVALPAGATALPGTYAAENGATVTIATDATGLIAKTSDPAMLAALQPLKSLPKDLLDSVTARATALLHAPVPAAPVSANGDDIWNNFLVRNGQLADAKIVGYAALDGDIGVWVAGTLKGAPTFVRMRFGPRHMVGLTVSADSPSVHFLPQGAGRFIAYDVPTTWQSALAFGGDGVDLTGEDGTVHHLRRANVAAVAAPSDTQRLASVEPMVALAQPTVTLPMAVDRFKPVIDVTIDGKGPFHFGIETGAPFIAMRQRVIDALGLKPAIAGDPALYDIASIDADGLELTHVRALQTEAADPSIDGILGLNAFASLLMTLDYPGKTVTFAHGALPEPNGRDVLATVPIAFGFGVPLEIGSTTTAAFIDTRSETALGVSPSLAGGLHFAYAPVAVGMARGAGFAPIPVKASRLDGDIALGDYTIQRPIVDVRQLPPYLPSQPLLGGRIISQFVVTLDQRHNRVRFMLPAGTVVPAPPTAPFEKSSP